MSATRKATALFYFQMARHTRATVAQCERLMRLAAGLHRLDVAACNELWTDAHEQKQGRLHSQVGKVCREIQAALVIPSVHETKYQTVTPVFTYEPMACAVVIKVPDGYSDQVGEPKGIGVPA